MIMSFIIYSHASLGYLEQAMKPSDLRRSDCGLIVAVVPAVAGLVRNWTPGGGLVLALGGATQNRPIRRSVS
jgi:hypothetical protein